MKVTLEKLNELDACYDAVQWFKKQKTNNIHELFELAKENHLDWANWYLVRILTKAQKIQYAVFAAKSVLHIYQEKYPDDKRPENAIQAAKKYLKNPTAENKRAAAAANAAASAAANAAASAAACAAYAAAYAASAAAASAATYAAYAAAYAASAAAASAATYAAKKELMIKIIEYGLSLLNSD